jgi:hypothetical protein
MREQERLSLASLAYAVRIIKMNLQTLEKKDEIEKPLL